MALKYIIENAEELSENLREHYREEGGKFYLEAEGLKPAADVEKLTKALDSERKIKKQFQDSSSAWESKFTGKNPDEVFAQLERIPLLEAAGEGKIDNKRHQEIIDTTVKQRMAPLEHDNTKLKQTIAERDQEILQFKSADRRRTIHDAVRAVASKEGFQETAYSSSEGALMLLAERHLTINSVGDVVVSDESRFLTPGLAVREALVEIGNHHPYMKKQSVGGGAAGSNGTAGTGTNPFKSNDMTARGRFIKENEKDPNRVEFMVKQAGLPSPWAPYTGK